ncbi:DUF333 domain-containing protein [Candidatus Pacearchaeota archaeon]|nr:DUF333 domain-containing protein [Candidatus Pacearchaeota archaeon]
MKNNKLFLITLAIILTLAVITTLALFCFKSQSLDENSQTVPVAIANPAATFCIEQGGESKIKTNEDGSQSGLCIIDGQEYDDWEYFRNNQK